MKRPVPQPKSKTLRISPAGALQISGDLPEITAAATSLRAAIEQTYVEIDDAASASRFHGSPTAVQQEIFDIESSRLLSPRYRQAFEQGGEAGLKREQLRVDLEKVTHDLFSLIHKLVAVRTDLEVSKMEF